MALGIISNLHKHSYRLRLAPPRGKALCRAPAEGWEEWVSCRWWWLEHRLGYLQAQLQGDFEQCDVRKAVHQRGDLEGVLGQFEDV